jgi:hypothetical protein
MLDGAGGLEAGCTGFDDTRRKSHILPSSSKYKENDL